MRSSAVVVVLAGLVACGDSGGGSVSDSNGASQSGTGGATDSTGATEPTTAGSMSASSTGDEGGMSASQSGTTGDEGGMSESLSGTVSSGAESESMSGGSSTATTGMISGSGGETSSEGGEESSSGEPVDCTSFDNEADCVAADCMAILGRKFVSDDADLCLDAPSFLACQEQAACAEVITTACKGQVKYQLPNACVPDGFKKCDPPVDAGMDGYKDCP